MAFSSAKTTLRRLGWGEISNSSFGWGAEKVFLILIPLAAVRTYTEGELADADFEALVQEGALNGVDTSFLEDESEETQGGDLRGGAVDDLLILAGDDTAQGGDGEDQFILNEDMVDENTVQIIDYDGAEDIIAVEYEGGDEPVLDTRDRGEDAIILIGEDILALDEGGAGLSAAGLRLVQSA